MAINIFQYATAASFAVTTYKTYGSPYAFLMNSEKRLKKVKSRFNELSPEQRLEIEAAIQSQDSECKSLDDLQQQLKDLLNSYHRLSKRYEEATLAERHFPYSQIRNRVSELDRLTKSLLNDTLKTTVPWLDNIDFEPNTLRDGPSSSESPDSSALTAPSPEYNAPPMSLPYEN